MTSCLIKLGMPSYFSIIFKAKVSLINMLKMLITTIKHAPTHSTTLLKKLKSTSELKTNHT